MASREQSCGDPVTGWTKVGQRPERWERAGFGVVVAREPTLWSFLPVCGHAHYSAFNLTDALVQAEDRQGLCFTCWQKALRDKMLITGVVPVARRRISSSIRISSRVGAGPTDDGFAAESANARRKRVTSR